MYTAQHKAFKTLSKALGSALLVLCLGMACSKTKVERQDLGMNIDSAYMMLTREVDMMISDSGQTKYRLIAPLWIIYDRSDRREWIFPDSLRMWSVDSVKPGNRLVAADSAIYNLSREEWILMGNVKIDGYKGEKLYTQRLHWLRGEKRLFSNDTTYFYTEGKVLHGNRFEAKDDLSQYTIYTTRGDFRVQDNQALTDSAKANQAKATKLEDEQHCQAPPPPPPTQ